MSRAVAASEVQRIIALVPWLDAHPGATLAEIAARFGVGAEEARADLSLVMMIGVPPYTPDAYIDVHIDDDDRVWLRLGELFRRPLSLTPSEGIALLAAGQALLAVPGSDPDGPLATALTKLRAVLDVGSLDVDVATSEHLAVVQHAALEGNRIEIDYWSAGRDERTTRRIDPWVVFYALGHWYASAYCHRAQAERVFRVDRIRAVRPTGERFEPGEPDRPVDTALYTPSPDDERVTLVLSAAATWVAEVYPTESVEDRGDGRTRIVLAVSSGAWLERLLLQLGAEVEIVAPPDWRRRRSDAARAVLARYRAGDEHESARRGR